MHDTAKDAEKIGATFWLVWNPKGRAPTHRHASEASATDEAERLARVNRGETFVVLESVCSRQVDDMVRVSLRAASDLEPPF